LGGVDTQSRYPIKDARPPTQHSPFYKPDALCATRPNIHNDIGQKEFLDRVHYEWVGRQTANKQFSILSEKLVSNTVNISCAVNYFHRLIQFK
jgi:hypothetical protein